ncbi:hypothetical protein F2Q68_00044784 [Brassica cretica]|uniref:Uncharacterized protein n=1 Tax=Brassica cretica TaxID=69181 RepID=A0A8S9LS55_BRACR|nr:hypothetical protein F2Q68_00044784 [Brassica cretica]
MATNWNRGVSIDAKPNLLPFRSLLATDFARKLVVAISEGMLSRAPSHALSHALSHAPSPAHPCSVTGASTLRHRLIHAPSPAHPSFVTGSSTLCHRLFQAPPLLFHASPPASLLAEWLKR